MLTVCNPVIRSTTLMPLPLHANVPGNPVAMFRTLILACFFLLVTSASFAAEPVAEVVGLRGSATVLQNGSESPLAQGQQVGAGALIRTSESGRVKLRFIDGSVVVISDSTSFQIDHMELDSQGRRSRAGFVLDIGLIGQTVAPSPGSTWAVRTPTTVTSVRGTEYLIEVNHDRRTDVNIRSGAVVVEPLIPAEKSRSLTRSGLGLPPPVLLNAASAGTECDPETFTCAPVKTWGEAREASLDARLEL